jgi:hypothetical protein
MPSSKYIDFHDFTFNGIEIRTGQEFDQRRLIIKIGQHWTKRNIELHYEDCVNIDLNLDIEILQDNYPCNIECLEQEYDFNEQLKLLKRQRKLWNVSYGRGKNPVLHKNSENPRILFFRLRIFGGTLIILASGYKVVELSPSP